MKSFPSFLPSLLAFFIISCSSSTDSIKENILAPQKNIFPVYKYYISSSSNDSSLEIKIEGIKETEDGIKEFQPNGFIDLECFNLLNMPVKNGLLEIPLVNIDISKNIDVNKDYINTHCDCVFRDDDNNQKYSDLIHLIDEVKIIELLFKRRGGYHNIPWGISKSFFNRIKNNDEKENRPLNYNNEKFIKYFGFEDSSEELLQSIEINNGEDEIHYIFCNDELFAVEYKLKKSKHEVYNALNKKYNKLKSKIERKTFNLESTYLPDSLDGLRFTYSIYDVIFKIDDNTNAAFVGKLLDKTVNNERNAGLIEKYLESQGPFGILSTGMSISSEFKSISDVSLFYFSPSGIVKASKHIQKKKKEEEGNFYKKF